MCNFRFSTPRLLTALAPALAALALALAMPGVRPAHAQAPHFEGLGDLAGGAVESVAHAVSADGSVVVGESASASGLQAFQWTSSGGLVGLGFLPGGSAPSSAHGVSADGGVIVGSSADSGGVQRAFRFSSGTFTALNRQGCSDCEPLTDAWAVSADGLVVVGSSLARSGGGALHLDPVRWPGGGTSLSNLGNLPGGEEVGEAFGASANGATIVGMHFTNDGPAAWTWTGSGLAALPAATALSPRSTVATAISKDASTVVGYGSTATQTLPNGTVVATAPQALRWTGASWATLASLGALPGAPVTRSQALATNADGSIIVGRAIDAQADDVAFVWEAGSGMRELKQVLEDDYGLDLTGWLLVEATGVSDTVAGVTHIVGNGFDPQGDPEAWLARLVTPACRNGLDDDGDGDVDHPQDAECNGPNDWSEVADCSDGLDDDGDGDVDFPADADCRSASDPSEQPDCSDGLDNDGDGLIDTADDGCADAQGQREDPACADGLDNDGDLATDFPADAQCTSPFDASETPDCSDGLDNDGDGLVDHPADPECASASGASEAGQCADGIDNDGDGRIDHPDQYPGCTSPDDPIEAAQCADGVDNDGDGQIDHPADTGCASADGRSESPVDLASGGLFVVDRTSRSVFRVDPATGVQTPVSVGARLEAPQGLASWGFDLLVADPAGLVRIDGDGVQTPQTPPLLAHESLQVVTDAFGHATVLEADGLYTHAPGTSTKTLWMSIPSPEPLPNLGELRGDTLAIEASGTLLTTGQGFLGGGVMRISVPTPVASPLVPFVFEPVLWRDLAIEPGGDIVAVGEDFAVGVGVYRIDPSSGARSALDAGPGWHHPTGVTVDAATGDIYVADAGVCADGACNGGAIVRVDPTTGATTPISSGGLIAGEMDLVFLPEPKPAALWIAGLTMLAALSSASRRSRRSMQDTQGPHAGAGR